MFAHFIHLIFVNRPGFAIYVVAWMQNMDWWINNLSMNDFMRFVVLFPMRSIKKSCIEYKNANNCVNLCRWICSASIQVGMKWMYEALCNIYMATCNINYVARWAYSSRNPLIGEIQSENNVRIEFWCWSLLFKI